MLRNPSRGCLFRVIGTGREPGALLVGEPSRVDELWRAEPPCRDRQEFVAAGSCRRILRCRVGEQLGSRWVRRRSAARVPATPEGERFGHLEKLQPDGCAYGNGPINCNHMVVDEVRSGLLQGEVVSHSSDVDNIDDEVDNDEVVDRIFRALADATRRNILVRTGQGGQSVSALAGYYDMSFAGVQKHVAVLERAGLVAKERRGREQIVRANPPAIRKATELLDAFEQLWTHRTDQMASILAEEGDPT